MKERHKKKEFKDLTRETFRNKRKTELQFESLLGRVNKTINEVKRKLKSGRKCWNGKKTLTCATVNANNKKMNTWTYQELKQ